MPHSAYHPQSASSLLMNLTSISISSLHRCAGTCLNNEQCRTATYYQRSRTCSLYSEDSKRGTIPNVGDPTISVLIIKNRTPKACVLCAQSSWAAYATTVAGNPSGIPGSALTALDQPIPIYYDQPYRRFIVGDDINARVMQFSLDNVSADGIVIAGNNGVGCVANQFRFITGVAMDSVRQLYVADSTCLHILRFPPNSNSTTFGTIINTVYPPQGIFNNPLTDELYVALYTYNAVIKLIGNGTSYVVVAGGNNAGNGFNQLEDPNYAYFDYLYTNSLYVVDSGNNRILRFPVSSTSATDGVVVAGGNGMGNGLNQLNNPTSVVVGCNGILLISDKKNNRIQRWLPNANIGSTIAGGTSGVAANQLDSPEFIFFDENFNLCVVDGYNNRVQSFNFTSC